MIHGAFFFASDVCAPVREKMDMCVVLVYGYHGRAVTAFAATFPPRDRQRSLFARLHGEVAVSIVVSAEWAGSSHR